MGELVTHSAEYLAVEKRMKKARKNALKWASHGAETNNINYIAKAGKATKEWFFLRDVLLRLEN